MLGRLSWRLKPHQLWEVLRASVHPMIQLNVVSRFLEQPTSSEELELPNNQHKRVNILMTLDPTARSLKVERVNSPTHLLAVAVAFKIIIRFSGNSTQSQIQCVCKTVGSLCHQEEIPRWH